MLTLFYTVPYDVSDWLVILWVLLRLQSSLLDHGFPSSLWPGLAAIPTTALVVCWTAVVALGLVAGRLDKDGQVLVPKAQFVHDQNEVLPEALAHEEVNEGVEGCGSLAEKTSRVTKHWKISIEVFIFWPWFSFLGFEYLKESLEGDRMSPKY